MSDISDSEKTEIVLGLNAFNKPAEVSGIEAWTKLICNLLFMEKGSYPTDPDMGCEIHKYRFHFIEDVIDELTERINSQVTTYLPDIPLAGVNVSKEQSNTGQPILLIALEFDVEGQNEVAVVAAEKVNKKINFATAF